ncbi:PLC-like phosphodiesterase [Sordaria brevicollis]|uniref:PLC-like phosphodiesterase n=1 Tax=Sordaria brevicollis TaxID=83679 RepID=A0AAE0PLX5_SORBR|nr:PLC-like phosphodiesterase [Sordaria brevicollis]
MRLLNPFLTALALTANNAQAAPLFDSLTTFFSHLTSLPPSSQPGHLDLTTPSTDPTGLSTLSSLGSSAKSVLSKSQAYLLVINASPFLLRKQGGHSYQMPSWDGAFPNEIQPGESVRVKVEAKGQGDDAGEMAYTLVQEGLDVITEGVGLSWGDIEFQYRGRDGPKLQVQFKTLAAVGAPVGSVKVLEWHQGNNVPFVLSAAPSAGNLSAGVTSMALKTFDSAKQLVASPGLSTAGWMRQGYERMHCLQLREMALPGTHNSGMSLLTGGTPLVRARPESVQCHASHMTVGKQLEAGARWFDIRPVISKGKWATGHYTFFNGIPLPSGLDKVPGLGDLAKEIGKIGGGDDQKLMDGWQGGNGQMIADIITELNDFTSKNPGELVVVNLGHGLDTDHFEGKNETQARLSQEQWEGLMTELLRVKNRATHIGENIDLSQQHLFNLLPPLDPSQPNGPNRRSTVLLVVDDKTPDNKFVSVDKFKHEGFFYRGQLAVFDSYANTNKLNDMINDQFGKMERHRTSADDGMFLLSWTLTQPVDKMITGTIVRYAEEANRALGEKLWARGKMTRGRFPNVVSVDAFEDDGEVLGVVAGINWWLARECPVLGGDGCLKFNLPS